MLLLGGALLTWIVGVRIYNLMALGYVDSAIGTIRNIVSSESAFADAHPLQGYTCRFSELSDAPVLAELAKNNIRNGYTFQIDGCDPLAKPNRKFRAIAAPLRKGMAVFCSDESGILKSGESTENCVLKGRVFQ